MSAQVVPVREAATVILLRDSDSDGLQTWLLSRVRQMAFAAGATVFPGGGVDPADAEPGPDEPAAHIAAVAAQLATTTEHAAGLLRAAVRETLEETDVTLPLAALWPWARWITPRSEARRYDTYFFIAQLPATEVAASVSSEASEAGWTPIGVALAEVEDGRRHMLPPTIVNLRLVAQYGNVAAVIRAAASRSLAPIEPTLVRDENGALGARLPDGQWIGFGPR